MRPRITRAAYPMNRASSGNTEPTRSDMLRYASCNSVVTLMLAGAIRRASCRLASRCNSRYRVLNNALVAVGPPLSAIFAIHEMLDTMRPPGDANRKSHKRLCSTSKNGIAKYGMAKTATIVALVDCSLILMQFRGGSFSELNCGFPYRRKIMAALTPTGLTISCPELRLVTSL